MITLPDLGRVAEYKMNRNCHFLPENKQASGVNRKREISNYKINNEV